MTLRYTAEGSHLPNDMLVHPGSRGPVGRRPFGPGSIEERGILMVVCLDLAVGAGSLTLRDSDPHIQPFLDYNYLQEEFDRSRMREGVRICLELAEHEGWASLVKERVEPTCADPRIGRSFRRMAQARSNDQPSRVGHLQDGPGL